jgi:hypothetical protein
VPSTSSTVGNWTPQWPTRRPVNIVGVPSAGGSAWASTVSISSRYFAPGLIWLSSHKRSI